MTTISQSAVALLATIRIGLTLAIALLMASCVAIKPATPIAPPASVGSAGYPSDLRGARLFKISADLSSLHVLVYRGGTLASLGHNHVMTSNSISGYVWLANPLERSGFSITVPVNELIVDDNDARAAEGGDFPLNVNDDARTGTKRNMLSAGVLDGEHYPFVTLRSVAIGGTVNAPQVTFDLTLKDQTRRLSLPVILESSDQRLRVKGEFEIKQTDFGIKPYSVAMGALQVQDLLKIKFDLVAVTK